MESREKERAECIRISDDVECGFLQQHLAKKHPGINAKAVHDFYYESKMSADDPMPKDIAFSKVMMKIGDKKYEAIPSWYERRCQQWDREIEVEVHDREWTLRRKENV